MDRNSSLILHISIILILLSIAGGIFIPQLIFAEKLLPLQFVFTSILLITLGYFILLHLEKRLAALSNILKDLMDSSSKVKTKPLKKNSPIKYIRYYYENLSEIFKVFRNSIVEQDILLKKYILLNKKMEKNSLIREVINEVSNSIIKINDADALLSLILEKIIDIIDDAEKGSIMVLTDERNLEFRTSVGFDTDKLKKISLNLQETFLWRASDGKIEKPCIIRDIRSFNNYNLAKDSYKSFEDANALNIEVTLSSPIIIDGQLYGMINIDSTKDNAFNNEDMSLMEYFSNQISIAIKNHQLLEKTITLSRYDRLTNVYNRHYFEELLNIAHKKALRYEEVFCLVVFDLDNFKYINDTLGHIVGDEVLSAFAQTMKDNIRDTDLFSRYGGDEFIGAFFNTDRIFIEERMEKIANILKNFPIKDNNTSLEISFSYGISCFPQESKEIATLLQIADKRMYENKNMKKSAS